MVAPSAIPGVATRCIRPGYSGHWTSPSSFSFRDGYHVAPHRRMHAASRRDFERGIESVVQLQRAATQHAQRKAAATPGFWAFFLIHSLSHYHTLTDTLRLEIGDIGGPSDTDQSALVISRHTRRDYGLPVRKALNVSRFHQALRPEWICSCI